MIVFQFQRRIRISDHSTDSPERPLSALETAIRFQTDRNRRNRMQGPGDEHHRQQVTQLILATHSAVAQAEQTPSLMILGAGNCRDVDLKTLLHHFSVIHLVDLDRESVEAVIAEVVAELPDAAERLKAHAPVDVASPLLETAPGALMPAAEDGHSESASGPVDPEQFFRELAGSRLSAELPQAGVVVSLCLLSQLVESLSRVVLQHSPHYIKSLLSLRIGHLRRMLNLCLPQGGALLVTDVVSSDTAPALLNVTAGELKPCLKTCFEQNNYFSGCHPERIVNDLQILAAGSDPIQKVHVQDPWIWKPGPRAYAVYAVQVLLHPDAAKASNAADATTTTSGNS